MSPGLRRILVTVVILVAAIGVVTVVAINRGTSPARTAPSTAPSSTPSAAAGGAATAGELTATGDVAAPGATDGGTTDAGAGGPTMSATPEERQAIASWKAVAPAGGLAGRAVDPVGSLDPRQHQLQLEVASRAAGLSRIAFAAFWETSEAKRQAEAHWAAQTAGQSTGGATPPLPAEDLRYILQTSRSLEGFEVPLLAVHSLEVDGEFISLFGDVWSLESPGTFVSEIRDADGTVMLRVRRVISLGADGFDIGLAQSVENLSERPLSVRWIQYGPTDLRLDRSRYIDIRRFHFGYLMPPSRDPGQEIVLTEGQMYDRTEILKSIDRGAHILWPNPRSLESKLSLSWIGTTNRYFGFAVHAPSDLVTGATPTRSAEGSIAEVRGVAGLGADGSRDVLSEIHSPVQVIAPGGSASFDLGVYAGPLDRAVLAVKQPYESLGMAGLILYLMSGCCTWCTFSWLAHFLLTFLSFLHDYVVFDWGVAIVVLVVVVRALLHPILKRSQVQMQRTTRAMGALKPEIEKLQERYKGDPQKLQQETFRLYREKGVNPAGCIGGFIPTLLQMPIWIALYAMLYFAIELRQQPAFFGVFQWIGQLWGGWSFLADLSSSDHFFWEFAEPRHFLLWNLTGINLIPILMGGIFWVQQKYMTPPPAMKLSAEQEQQQKLMKIMMVVMFPLMLYSAPSGLTLYIMTSSLIGIVEGRQIRKQVERMDLEPPKAPKAKKQDMLGRMYEQALKRQQEKQALKRNPPKKYKER